MAPYAWQMSNKSPCMKQPSPGRLVSCHGCFDLTLSCTATTLRCLSVQAAGCDWVDLVDRILEPHDNPEKQRWLPGAQLNVAECALTGWDPDAPALLWAAEGSPDRLHSLTLDQLRRRCCAFAASLRSCGYRPGDKDKGSRTAIVACSVRA